jgi:hypothetical protein
VDQEFDPTRLAYLQEALGTGIAEIASTLDTELSRAIAQLEAGLEAGEMEVVAHSAHAARNSALMLDAHPLLGALTELETAARADDVTAAREALPALREAWPALRLRLAAEAERAERG